MTMAKFTITAPVATFRGDLAGLIFRDGRAVADGDVDRAALDYCRRRGYTIEPVDSEQPEEASDVDEGEYVEPDRESLDAVERPKDYASKAEWVAFAVAQGADETDAENATKSELVERYGS